MNLHEYQAKGLFAEYGLPVSEGYAVDTADEAVAAAEKIGGNRWVVKVQVHAGGRGKAGGVKLADSTDEVRAFAEQEVLEGAEENLALVLNVQGQCELYLGDDDAARKTLLRAARRPRAHDLRGAQARHPDGRRGRG